MFREFDCRVSEETNVKHFKKNCKVHNELSLSKFSLTSDSKENNAEPRALLIDLAN